MQFKDIEGQRVLINHLTEIIDSGRVSHAQMIVGPTRNGSLALALAYAQYLNCEQRVRYPEGSELRADSCGQCPTCRKYRELMHPDLHLFFPNTTTARVSGSPTCEELRKDFQEFMAAYGQRGTEEQWYEHLGVDNRQGMIREKDAAEIVRVLGLKPYEQGYKVVLVWLPERMNGSAANELLKTLEEPTDRTLFMLVSENTDRILPTVLSRVQQIAMPSADFRLSAEREAQFGEMFVSWMRLLFKLNMKPLSDWVDKTAAMGRETHRQFLQFALESVRACFLKTAAGIVMEQRLQFGDDRFNAMFPAMVTPRNVEGMSQAMSEALFAIERNANAKITFMNLSFKLSKLIKNR